ncbi:MAG: hypothetical protein AAF517_26600, partial [Planctomycetota bacterium]
VGSQGGNDEIPEASVSNRWAHFQDGTWTSWDESGSSSHIIGWNDGFGNQGANIYGLARGSLKEISYWTEPSSHNHGGENRPRFTSVEYMIKVR